jgi:hypothetical protein
VRTNEDPVVAEFLATLEHLAPPLGSDDPAVAVRVLCAALTMRPALLASASNARSVLRMLDLEGTGLSDLREAIAGYLNLGLELSPTVLGGVRDQEAWRAQIRAVQEGAAAFLDRASGQKLNYEPATEVWHYLVEKRTDVRAALEAVASGQRAQAPAGATSAGPWRAKPK